MIYTLRCFELNLKVLVAHLQLGLIGTRCMVTTWGVDSLACCVAKIAEDYLKPHLHEPFGKAILLAGLKIVWRYQSDAVGYSIAVLLLSFLYTSSWTDSL